MELVQKYWQKVKQVWQQDGILMLLYRIVRKVKRKLQKELQFLWQPCARAFNRKFRRTQNASPKSIGVIPDQPRLCFPRAKNPEVSIIIYAHNHAQLTYNCLVSIHQWIVNSSREIEIFLIEDASSEPVELISGIWIFNQTEKQGFVTAIHHASLKAKGKYVLALRQDALLTQNAIDHLISTLEHRTNNSGGIVFPKLTYPNRELCSAGGLIWNSGELENYGVGDFSGEPEYNYCRQLDFGRAIAFLISTELWHSLDWDVILPIYRQADYAIADLCLTLKHQCHQNILYQPQAEIICQYGLPDSYKLADHSKGDQFVFKQKWQEVLEKLHSTKHKGKSKDQDQYLATRKSDRSLLPTILIIDTLVPAYDKESGALRLFNIIRILLDRQYQVIFLPDYGHEQEPYTSELEAIGVEVLYFTYQQSDWRDRLVRRLPIIDLAWVCRPELCQKYFPILQLRPEIKLIYDTIDLHFLRLKRAWEIELSQTAKQVLEKEWQEMQKLEMELARKADLTLVVTDIEKQILESANARQVQVVPNIHQIYTKPIPNFSDRHNLLFIGGYYHKPNVDAVIWLCQEIMPLVWQSRPEICLTLLGSNPTSEVLELKRDRIFVPGYIADVEPYFLNHRLFVAPLRYGAGMKGKIGHSLSYGLPTITTAIGAEGIGLIPEQNVLIADQAEDFALAILRLYENELLWQHLSINSFEVLRPFTQAAVSDRLQVLLRQILKTA